MANQYHEYRLRLLVLGPVHIGNGSTYSAKDYIYENNGYYFPDLGKMYLQLPSAQRVALERFLQAQNREKLVDFMHHQNITTRDFGGYTIEASNFETDKKGRLNEIRAFVKDPYGNPYIPGSSLKGALRTILVNEKFTQGDKSIPWGGEDDILNEIRVSDSEPIEKDRLIIVQKWDLNRRKLDPKPLPLYREALKPMTKVDFTITATSSRATELINQLPQLAEQMYEYYRQHFLADYPNRFIQDNRHAPLYLGAGSGLWTKIDRHHADLRAIAAHTPSKMKMKGKGVMKLTRYLRKNRVQTNKKTGEKKRFPLINNDQSFYEMGKCGFTIKRK